MNPKVDGARTEELIPEIIGGLPSQNVIGVTEKLDALTASPACVRTVIRPDAPLGGGKNVRRVLPDVKKACDWPFNSTSVTFTKFVPVTSTPTLNWLGVPVPPLGGLNEVIVGGPGDSTVRT